MSALLAWIKIAAKQSLHMDLVRGMVAGSRFAWYAWVRRRLRTLDDSAPGVTPLTVAHNLRGLRHLAASRSTRLIRALSALEGLEHTSRVLAVGPRTEGELLNLVAHGFRPSSVRGLDLISYSPWVDLGNMHAMPYADASWDAVLLGWVLAYSSERARAAAEVTRVCRPGGVVAVGVEWNPLSDDDIVREHGYRVGGATRIQSTAEVLSWFEPRVDEVYFRHDIAPERRHLIGSIMVVFSLRKDGSGAP